MKMSCAHGLYRFRELEKRNLHYHNSGDEDFFMGRNAPGSIVRWLY